jgi:hypothetical protein
VREIHGLIVISYLMYLLLLKLKSTVHTLTIVLKTCTAETGLSYANSSEQRDYKNNKMESGKIP